MSPDPPLLEVWGYEIKCYVWAVNAHLESDLACEINNPSSPR